MSKAIRKSLRPLAVAVSMASALAIAGPAQAEPASYEIDPTHTFVYFEVVHFGTSTVRGRFNDVAGTIMLDPAAGKGKVDITVDARSIDSGVPDFDAHLKTADFFNVEQTPTVRFVADRFEFDGDELEDVHGELTLLGKTLPVTLEAERFNCYHQPVLKADMCGGDFETTITRSQWGMNWGIEMGVPDKVEVRIQIEAARQ
ncbi:MAG: YceI family protein [Burkholderiaceae bacterium]